MFIDIYINNLASFMTSSSGIGYLWLIAAIIFLLLELATPGLFFFISFSIGCAIAAGLTLLEFSLTLQITGATLATIIGFFILKKLFIQKNTPKLKTNIDALIGQTGVVTQAIAPLKPGRVRIGGQEWMAIAHDNLALQENTHVTIIKVKGNKLLVK
ncbi:MAG: NfeD family protein [bacterium]